MHTLSLLLLHTHISSSVHHIQPQHTVFVQLSKTTLIDSHRLPEDLAWSSTSLMIFSYNTYMSHHGHYYCIHTWSWHILPPLVRMLVLNFSNIVISQFQISRGFILPGRHVLCYLSEIIIFSPTVTVQQLFQIMMDTDRDSWQLVLVCWYYKNKLKYPHNTLYISTCPGL